MGTIADLLGGIDLSALTEQAPAEGKEKPSEHDAQAVDGAQPDARTDTHEAVLAAILSQTNLRPENARAELTLRGDLDMDTLQLYAVVVQIERELKTTFPDELIDQWETIGDILDAVRQ